LLFLQDNGGDENFHLFAVGEEDSAPADLTPYEGVNAEILSLDYARTDEILVLMNLRDSEVFDVYRLDIKSGRTTLDTQNSNGIDSFIDDASMSVRAAVVQRSDGAVHVLLRRDVRTQWRTLATFPPDDGSPQLVGFSRDGRTLFLLSTFNSNSVRLLGIDTSSGAVREVCADPHHDVSEVLCSTTTKEPIAACIIADRKRWQVLDAAYAQDFTALAEQIPGDLSIESSDAADRRWLVLSVTDDETSAYWLYDRSERSAHRLFSVRPALDAYTLSSMHCVKYAARDGREIQGYLTLPAGLEPRNLPSVLLVHGGPWLRDIWGFNRTVQWLANRGYAVMQPNFRGSTGYGKDHLNAGDRQWAGTMHTDLLDARDWLIAKGYSDPMRIGIMGRSYGGYAVLTALARAPDVFACGVDVVGPSNLNTLLNSLPPYWETQRVIFARRMGEDPDFLAAQSPLHRAGSIQRPLLIAQGASDPRVKMQESEQIVLEIRRNGRDVTYVVFEDEGHGFVRPENLKRFNAALERFFAEHLGGRYEAASENEAIEAFLR
jgi:dipeptidyl aminopeptidase/acylaminoacyl peptidase